MPCPSPPPTLSFPLQHDLAPSHHGTLVERVGLLWTLPFIKLVNMGLASAPPKVNICAEFNFNLTSSWSLQLPWCVVCALLSPSFPPCVWVWVSSAPPPQSLTPTPVVGGPCWRTCGPKETRYRTEAQHVEQPVSPGAQRTLILSPCLCREVSRASLGRNGAFFANPHHQDWGCRSEAEHLN